MNEPTLTDTEREALEVGAALYGWAPQAEAFEVTTQAVELIVAARVAEAHEDGYQQGLAEGQERAETRDLSFDTKIAEAVDRERAAWATKIETLADEWAPAIRTLRGLLAADDTEGKP